MAIILGIIFVLSIQPMMVISSLIFIILLYTMMLFWKLSSFWFSYMVALVLMSGVLVVFTYMMSVLPNESFEVSSLILVIMGFVFLYKYHNKEEYLNDLGLSSVIIWDNMLLVSSMFLVIYLLGMMIMIVWLSGMEQGAVRVECFIAW